MPTAGGPASCSPSGYPLAGAGQTWPASTDDPVAWRRGRWRYSVWVMEAEAGEAPSGAEAAPASLVRRLAAVRSALGPALLATGPRQAHITLQVCGFSTPGPAVWDDDFDPAAQAAQWQALAALPPAQRQPFTLHIGGPDSFESAAFLRVEDRSGALVPLRRALALGHGEFRAPEAPWQPHLTVGLYRQACPVAEVMRRLDAAAAIIGPEPLALPVRRLLRVDYDARQFLGPLDLAGARVFALEGAASLTPAKAGASACR